MPARVTPSCYALLLLLVYLPPLSCPLCSACSVRVGPFFIPSIHMFPCLFVKRTARKGGVFPAKTPLTRHSDQRLSVLAALAALAGQGDGEVPSHWQVLGLVSDHSPCSKHGLPSNCLALITSDFG